MANIVVVSGQFGSGVSFAGSPVIVRVSGLDWPKDKLSPFTVVRIEVKDSGGNIAGTFHTDTAQQTETVFDISTALRAIWSDYDFSSEVSAAASGDAASRSHRSFSISLSTEYMSSDGVFTTHKSGKLAQGLCAIGWLTEWERSRSVTPSNSRYGAASTKPVSSPELVGKSSITSWVDVSGAGTTSTFYLPNATTEQDTNSQHSPLVLRDSIDYTDFLFVNRRGAVETCSARTLESMGISVKTKQYNRMERPSYSPSRSLMTVSSGGRRTWQMSSGGQTREWAEWWAQEFLMARQWWMLYKGPGQQTAGYVPVIVEPSKENIAIYDKAKQQMPHVDFTVTMALEG